MTQQTKEPVSAKESIRQTRIQKLAELADKGINPYPYAFDKDADAKDLQESIRIFLPEKKQKIFILLQAELWQYVTLECY